MNHRPLFLLTMLAFVIPCGAAECHAPIIRNGYVMRTIQQDAELRDWIEGSQKATVASKAAADTAIAENDRTQKKNTVLQSTINALAAHDQAATVLAVKAKAAEIEAKQAAHENAKERDVVVIGFAIAFAVSMGALIRSLTKWITESFPQFAPLAVLLPLIGYAGCLAAGYGFGRYVLFEIAKRIP